MRAESCPMRVAVLCVIFVALSGCRSNPPPKFSCSVPSSKNVATAFAQARRDLVHPQCQFQYDAYFDTLLATAASNPGEENKKRFSRLLAWSRQEDILSKLQAENYYRRYFTADFVSLDDHYNNCSTTCRDKQAVIKNLKDELRDKDRGLLQAADDKDSYDQADQEFNQLLTLIEATCQACQHSE